MIRTGRISGCGTNTLVFFPDQLFVCELFRFFIAPVFRANFPVQPFCKCFHQPPLASRQIASDYLRKGSQVYIEGSLRTRKWQDKQGQERYSTEIVGNELQMLGGRGGGAGAGATGGGAGGGGGARDPYADRGPDQAPPAGGGGGERVEDFDDDIPF